MKEIRPKIAFCLYAFEELSAEDQKLIEAAKESTFHSYAPYSHFCVGAAALLDNGEIICGSNQENAAYPSGLCAERTTLFYANSTFPDVGVQTLAIAARNEKGEFTPSATAPCGACRQVMLETQERSKHPLRTLLYGEEGVIEVHCVEDLLPLSFSASSM